MLRGFIGVCLLLLMVIIPFSLVQSFAEITPKESILEQINHLRRKSNETLLSPNPILDQVAQVFADDLSTHDIETRQQDFFHTVDDDKNLIDLLGSTGYPKYSDTYVADYIPFASVDITPDNLIKFFQRDADASPRTVISRQMSLNPTADDPLPLAEPRFREIGIAYEYSDLNKRYIYVIVFASQPGVIPVIVTTDDQPDVIATTVTTRQITLRIQNEKSNHKNGDIINDTHYIGTATRMFVSEQLPADQTCPAANSNVGGWELYQKNKELTLSDGFGPKTIFVELCDANRFPLISQVTVVYASQPAGTPAPATTTPDVLKIVQATQTAAAVATTNAPLLPTVEAILTQTATAMPP